MILVDTSVWIGLFRGEVPPPDVERMDTLLICPPVLQEVMQGIGSEPAAHRIERDLRALRCLADPVSADLYLEAAALYRLFRRKGATIRSANDALIAAIALRHRVPVWHRDRDFDQIARFTALEVMDSLS